MNARERFGSQEAYDRHLAYNRMVKRDFRKERRCVDCGLRDDNTLSGRARCHKHAENNRKAALKWYREHRAKQRKQREAAG